MAKLSRDYAKREPGGGRIYLCGLVLARTKYYTLPSFVANCLKVTLYYVQYTDSPALIYHVLYNHLLNITMVEYSVVR